MADVRVRMQAVPVRLARLFGRRRDRRRHGRTARWLLTWVGRDPSRLDHTAECRQCGEWQSVTLLRLGRRRVRYWCQRCGAAVSLPERTELRPVGQLRTTDPGSGPASPTSDESRPATSDLDPREVMPAAMLRWAAARSRRPSQALRLDRSTIYQLYRGWDSYLERLRPGQVAGLALDGEPPLAPGTPAFSTVVGGLHDACYRSELVLGRLLGSAESQSAVASPEVTAAALWVRIEHARRWLATRGRELCWIHRRVPAAGQVSPPRSEVETAMAALRTGRASAAERVIRGALFGTDGGPPLPLLLAAHPAEEVTAALAEYLASQARPLRERVLARLAAPLVPRPPDRDGWPR